MSSFGKVLGLGVTALLASASSVAAVPVAASATPMIWETTASVIREVPLRLVAGNAVLIETRRLSDGADPILHLLDPGGRQVAMDDDSGPGENARISEVAATSGVYRIVVRATGADTGGSTLLATTVAGSETTQRVGFDAWRPIDLPGLRAGERIGSVRLPAATQPGHALFVLGDEGDSIRERVAANGVDGAAEITVSATLGATAVVLATTGVGTEPARLVRNDAGVPAHDTDGDHLGRELEAAAGTCDSPLVDVAGVDCGALADRGDTDGDGLSDDLELVGARRPGATGALENLALPRWGANPRHKDLFVEVDFMRRTREENEYGSERTMDTWVARDFAMAYRDSATTDPAVRALHGAMLANPDGQPGIAAHLDIGRASPAGDTSATFGNWGGYTAVDAIEVDGVYQGVAAQDAWPTAMSPARRGVFRYALGYGSGGGQTGPGFTASYNFYDSFVSIHETGHSLGLGHGGPYGIQPDVNCKPNYGSLMNYAFTSVGTGFADGRVAEGPPLNNARLTERGVALGGSPAFFDRLRDRFGYYVDEGGGHVDWNRDGEFAPAGTTVRAYANRSLRGGGCEYTRYNRTRVAGAETVMPSVLARRDGRLFTFYTWDNEVWSTGSSSSWNCPVPEPTGCAGGSWSAPTSLGLPAPAGSADAVTIGEPGHEKLLVVAVDLNNKLWERTLDGGPSTAWHRVDGAAALGGPALERTADGTVMLAYTEPGSGNYVLRRLAADGTWGAAEAFRTADGTILRRSAGSRFSPELVEAGLAGVTGTYALLAGADDKADLYRYDPVTRRWSDTAMLDSRPGPINWRPAMAWVPPGPTSAIGRVHILYADREGGAAKAMMSYVAVQSTTRTQRIGLDTYFDNVWRLISGGDLLYEPGVDTNLRAVMSFTTDGPSEVWFVPKADGIHDSTYTNRNDWAVMRYSLCRDVVNPGGLVNNPIRCA